MRKVVHFEIPAEDLSRAKSFYGDIFGWELHSMPIGESEYTLVTTTPVDEKTMSPTEAGAINGGMMERSAEISGPVITIDVESIDEVLARIGSSGGSTVSPKMPIPGMGAVAYFKDSEGNVMGLWETAPEA